MSDVAESKTLESAAGTASADLELGRLPAVGRVLQQPAVQHLTGVYGSRFVTVQVRHVVAELREDLGAQATSVSRAELLSEVVSRTTARVQARLGNPVRRVLNATGVFLHTNLGRAPLPREIADRLPSLLTAACDLEIDLESGRRGQRAARVARRLEAITEAEAALVVNNNAAAMFLILSAFARGREVIVSRGELVEIGGSFRIPDVLAAAGATLVEVGTTNRTRIDDYRRALSDQTSLLLKVFPSNYRIEGFVAEVGARELAALGRDVEIPVLVDEGSGLLEPHRAPQLSDHPSFRELLKSGVSLVCGSGDKLLGGPQAGLIAGDAALVAALAKHPIYRALRPDRTTLAALEGVLDLVLAGATRPVDRLWGDDAEHRVRLEEVADAVGGELVPADAFLGGGTAPEAAIPGTALALAGPAEFAATLRASDPPVVGYQREGRVILDLRTVDPADDAELVRSVKAAQARC